MNIEISNVHRSAMRSLTQQPQKPRMPCHGKAALNHATHDFKKQNEKNHEQRTRKSQMKHDKLI